MEEILNDRVVRTEVECQSWRDCVKACGDLLVAEGKIEPSFIDSMIQTVEELGPYMILIPKVAFFHGRPSEAVHKACLSLITLKDSVRFEEFEGQEISCAFGFGAVDADSHVNMLVKVAKLLQDEDFVRLITQHGTKEAIMEKINQYQEGCME
ncbi:PTS sugar transporter subunit IIA [Clostridium sp. AN503]|uniref:PTS sugar transporter subunit IIA n=1 Tax=Clostridium sp. AN503 TaxID=3160598 RepID=UPI0034589B15